MKILITGGAGFIGSHLADALLAAGHTVHVLDNLFSGLRSNVPTGATFHELDITSAEAYQLILQEKYEAILHQAAQMDVRKSVEDPSFDARVNVVGSVNLLEAAVKSGCKKFLFASTGGAGYGEQQTHPADEQHPRTPLSPYGCAKMSVEYYLHYYHAVYGLSYASLRYGNVYGPRQSPHGEAGVIAIFARKILGGQQPIINGDGLQTRDYVFVADVVAANMAALSHTGSGAFNVGTGIETDVVTLFTHINTRYGNKYAVTHGPAKAGEQRRSVLDATLAQRVLGWQPRHSLAQGMALTLDWFAQHHAQH